MSITLNGDTGITTPMYNGTISANAVTPSVSMKNRIINGAMVIDQRNAGASVSVTSSWAYCLDRFASRGMTGSGHTVQQSSTAPTGFVNSLKWTTGTGASVGAGDINGLFQAIEGYNFADLQWGTANAKTITLSFWVYSSLTGTFGGSLKNDDGNRSYPFSYTISSANTWEQKSITIAGDTTGTWKTTNAAGTYVSFGLGVGSNFTNTAGSWAAGNYISCTGATNLVATSASTFYITGVQLEVGSSATSFDYRQYGTELFLCQRYYFQLYSGVPTIGQGFTVTNSDTTRRHLIQFPASMRTAPTLSTTWSGGTPGTQYVNINSGQIYIVSGSTGTEYSFNTVTATAEL